jgi:hypothetical protein
MICMLRIYKERHSDSWIERQVETTAREKRGNEPRERGIDGERGARWRERERKGERKGEGERGGRENGRGRERGERVVK